MVQIKISGVLYNLSELKDIEIDRVLDSLSTPMLLKVAHQILKESDADTIKMVIKLLK